MLRNELKSFIPFTAIGAVMFVLNLLALYVLREHYHVRYYIAVPVAFVVGGIVQYLIVRKYIFSATVRGVEEGLLYFLLINVLDAAVVTIGVTLLVEYHVISLYPARIGVGLVAGIINYILNTRYNFRAF